LSLTTGGGEDKVGISDQVGPFFNFMSKRLRQDVDLGDGNDVADIKAEGFSDDSLNLTAGDGNDTVSADAFYGRGVLKSTDSGKTWTLDLGPGDDRAEISSRGYRELTSSIDAGDGDDTIVCTASPTSPGSSPLPVLLVIKDQQDFHLGEGNDRLMIDASGYRSGDISIDAGNGDDNVQVRHRMFAIVDRTQLQFEAHLGAGSDTLQLDAAGYRRIRTAIETGSIGDGSDSIIVVCQSLRRSGRKFTSRTTLDEGADVVEVKARGYIVQPVSQTPISVEWVFVA
jgi:hypothetical protein